MYLSHVASKTGGKLTNPLTSFAIAVVGTILLIHPCQAGFFSPGTTPATEQGLASMIRKLTSQLRQKSSKETEVVLVAWCTKADTACYVYDIMDFDNALFYAKNGIRGYLEGKCSCGGNPQVLLINREGQFRRP